MSPRAPLGTLRSSLALGAIALALSAGCAPVESTANDDGAQESHPTWVRAFESAWISAIAPGPEGDVLLGGGFSGAIDFGGGTLYSEPNSSVFIAHLDAAGEHLMSGATGSDDDVRGVAIGPGGHLHVTGRFDGLINFGGGKLDGTHASFVATFDPGGYERYSFALESKAIVITSSPRPLQGGGVVLAAVIDETTDLGGGAPSPPSTMYPRPQLAIVAYDAGGAWSWEQRTDCESIYSTQIAPSPDGGIVLLASCYGPIELGALGSPGGTFVAKLSAKGEPEWLVSTVDGSAQNIRNVAVDDEGNVYLDGAGQSDFDFAGLHVANVGYGSAYLLKLSADGGGLWSRPFRANNSGTAPLFTLSPEGEPVLAVWAGEYEFAPGQGLAPGQVGVAIARFTPDGEIDRVVAKDCACNGHLSDLRSDGAGALLVSGGFDQTLDLPGAEPLTIEGDAAFVARIAF